MLLCMQSASSCSGWNPTAMKGPNQVQQCVCLYVCSMYVRGSTHTVYAHDDDADDAQPKWRTMERKTTMHMRRDCFLVAHPSPPPHHISRTMVRKPKPAPPRFLESSPTSKEEGVGASEIAMNTDRNQSTNQKHQPDRTPHSRPGFCTDASPR